MKLLITIIIFSYTLYSPPALSNEPASTNNFPPHHLTFAANSDQQNLHNNNCLQQLKDTDEVMVSAAFHDGAGGFSQLKELINRKPWGVAIRHTMQAEIDKLIKQESPFLMVKMTKKQALKLESHRDLIKWILVQSTETVCG